MKWNDLDWLSEVRDTKMLVKYTQDANGNRRSTIASIFWNGNWDPFGEENWYLYNGANKLTLAKGRKKNDRIQITPGQGYQLIYDVAGRQKLERTLNSEGNEVLKELLYLDNNLLSEIKTKPGNKISKYEYDGKVPRRSLLTTETSQHRSHYNHNSCLDAETFINEADKSISTTSYALNLLGNQERQTIKVRNSSGTDGYDELLTTHYAQFDKDKVAQIEATRKRLGGETVHSDVKVGYDPNGNTEIILGTNQKPRTFITNSKNRIVQKQQGSDQGNYFYTTSDQPLGYFGSIPEGLAAKPSHVNFDLDHLPIGEHFSPPTPGSFPVGTEDSFASISERIYGNESFADLIAEANGFSSEDRPPAGLVLTIPNINNSNVHNWTGQYPMYNPAAIIGSLYPNMPIPSRYVHPPIVPHRSHKKFWQILIQAVASTAVMAFAPEFAGLFTGLLSKFMGEALGFAIAGAASSLVQQEMAIGFGNQSKISLNAIGQNALLAAASTGMAKGLGMDLIKHGNKYKNLVQEATKNIEFTLALQGLSFLTGQQRHFEWKVLVASVANTLANVGAKQIELAPPLFNEALATASASVASLGIDKTLGNELDLEILAANTLGTFIGNQLAAQAKQRHAEFQARQAEKAFQYQTQIPEIQETLAESEHHFLQSLKAQPNPLGSINELYTPEKSAPIQTQKSNAALPQTRNNNSQTPPPQPHKKAETARKEEQLVRASKITQSTSKELYASRHRFWGEAKKTYSPIDSQQEPPTIANLLHLDPEPERNRSNIGPAIKFYYSCFANEPMNRNHGKYNIDYKQLYYPKDTSPIDKARSDSHIYDTPCSPRAGDVSLKIQTQSIDALITAAKKAHFSLRDTAHLLAIVRHESGFNPYAAAPGSTAAGLGQFVDKTWRDNHFTAAERWSMEAQVRAMIGQFKYVKKTAYERGQSELYFYKYHHDGPAGEYEGLGKGKKHVYPQIDKIQENLKNIF
ncbi:transglycosylase SLT domain-containing protein [Legionella sp. km772]|uniref:transglycosylase SLT domain-containing protein n=1 Tax=Legionella sp. km772 TaxID=2498111 RepID=UPI000F8DCB44|nr:transglycosylase SLT domain-containing protein [Legionella sp. km772]RUR07420.1 lytic transglycosylase domain-containing protein [Legionella sp. km772]